MFGSGDSPASNGTGFGLAILRPIVEAHGWQIDVTEGGVRAELGSKSPASNVIDNVGGRSAKTTDHESVSWIAGLTEDTLLSDVLRIWQMPATTPNCS